MQPDHIQRTIAHIEENLTELLDIDELARFCFISPAQLYRDFYSETGYSVKEYLRRRRLSKALAWVKASDMTLAEIAAECGYSSQQAFHKCVKATIGLTPLEYRADSRYFFFPKYNVTRRWRVSVSTETVPHTLRLIFHHSQLQDIENRALTQLLRALPEYRGRVFGRNNHQEGAQFCYELYIEDQAFDRDKLGEYGFAGFEPVGEISSMFATVTVANDDDAIGRAWDHLYTNWLKTSMFEQAEAPFFEEYLHKNGKAQRLILYLPIQKRGSYSGIHLRVCEDMDFLVARAVGTAGEEVAAQTVMTCLAADYPQLARSRRFYVAHHGADSICGVAIDQDLLPPERSGVEMLRHDAGIYAILEGDCVGDSSVYEAVLAAWVRENGYAVDGAPFTIYETSGGYAPDEITAYAYIRLKDERNG